MRVIAILLLLLSASPVLARFLGPTPVNGPDATWWESLHNKDGGYCCAKADGREIDDVRSKGPSAFEARLKQGWTPVPDNTLVLEPNKFGPAVIWTYEQVLDGKSMEMIRCFLPSAGA